jgi:asparagine synthase (glutamine-hydrolysing)
MCGIVGWLTKPGNEMPPIVLSRLTSSIRHRGPDDAGEYHDHIAGLALAHRRLSIIDPSLQGHQPMIHPESGDVLAFNGEIYNFRELRTELERYGCHFRSNCDTEVLMQGLAFWGLKLCLNRLRGMFAFAWWNSAESTLYLVRDPLGIKPLYYCDSPQGQGIVFASEIKALLSPLGIARRLDRRALRQFLEFGYTFDAECTIFEGVCKLPPGHFLMIRGGMAERVERYFYPNLKVDNSPTSEDWEDEIYATLQLVIAQHLHADAPLGLLLSGGLDSSLAASFAARSTTVRTLCMAFADSVIDERPHARDVARFIGAKHEEVLITVDDIQSVLEGTAYDFDDLFADWGTITTRFLYQKCRDRGIKVVIVGEGADELFGGYDIFRQGFSHLPQNLWLYRIYRNYCGRRYGCCFGLFQNRMREYLASTGGDRFAAIRLFESREQLPNNYVMKVDKSSMAVSVEARTPFLDQRVAEIAYRIPARHLISATSAKLVLRRMAQRYRLLPESTFRRPKFGASIAVSWMDESLSFREFARGIILAPGNWTEALGLDAAMKEYFLRDRTGYPFPHAISIFRNLAWRLLILELWARAYGVSAVEG